jgi:hypothetical protein
VRSASRGGGERATVTRLPFLYARQKTLNCQKGRSEIAADKSVPTFLADLSDRTGSAEAGARVRDQDIDPLEDMLDLMAHRLNLSGFGHVCKDTHRLSASVFDFRLHGRQGGPISPMRFGTIVMGEWGKGHLLFEVLEWRIASRMNLEHAAAQ